MKRNLSAVITSLFLIFSIAFIGCGDDSGGSDSSEANEITSFSFTAEANPGLSEDVNADITGTQIAATVPYIDTTALVATFSTDGASVQVGETAQESGVTPNDFTGAVTYTVTAEDGTKQDYIVTVTVTEASDAKGIISFIFTADLNPTLSEDVECSIEGTKIFAPISFGTDVSSLIPVFTITGVSVTVDETVQQSGLTANDFASPVVYSVTAEDSSIQEYVVTRMVIVDENNFLMGYSGFQNATEHDVTLSSFIISKHEITNQEIVDVFNWANSQDKFGEINISTVTNSEDSQELLDLDDDDCQIEYRNGVFLTMDGMGDNGEGGNVDIANYPCIEISWYGAAAFCNYLSQKEGLTPCYDLSDWSCNFENTGYRLPTEAEWEYAARYIDADSFRTGDSYSGSDIADDVAWYGDNSDATPHSNLDSINGMGTHQVGTKEANELGLFDMSGNVWEWCNDWIGSYGSESITDPIGPEIGDTKVIRGGFWGNEALDGDIIELKVSYRNSHFPEESFNSIGFRLVRSRISP